MLHGHKIRHKYLYTKTNKHVHTSRKNIKANVPSIFIGVYNLKELNSY